MKKGKFGKISLVHVGLVYVIFTLVLSGCCCVYKPKRVCQPCPVTCDAKVRKGCPKKTGAELWTENCQHCHNYRNAKSFSDDQWDIILMHMRSQARLTGEEAREILTFMKAGN